MKKITNSLYQKFTDIGKNHLGNTPISPTEFLREIRNTQVSQYSYKKELNQNIVFIFMLTHRLYCIWLRIWHDFFKQNISPKQVLRRNAFLLAPRYGTIIADPESRQWVDQVIIEKNITDKEEAFTLVWARCINHKKRTVSVNGQDRLSDILLFMLMIVGAMIQVVSLFFNISNPLILVIITAAYYWMIKTLFLMNKMLVFDANKLVKSFIE